ncbi:MAG TPA: GNAT family N-acetyltransferase [Anaerolineales bacterium]|nr:GNAT family N-acetyltransferase [Anaerolineales bacterium]
MMVAAENDLRRAGTIWALNLDEPVPLITPRGPATFRRVGPDLLPALVSTVGRDASREILQRFESGRRCYTAWVGDQLASYGWVSFDEEHIGELNLRVRLLPGEVYIWDCATIPVFRRNHLYSALLRFIIDELHAEEFCRAWIGADVDNLPSQHGIARAGFHHVGDLVIERVLAIRQVWVQERPGIPDHIVAEARRAFLNDRDKVWKTVATRPRTV